MRQGSPSLNSSATEGLTAEKEIYRGENMGEEKERKNKNITAVVGGGAVHQSFPAMIFNGVRIWGPFSESTAWPLEPSSPSSPSTRAHFAQKQSLLLGRMRRHSKTDRANKAQMPISRAGTRGRGIVF